MKHLLLLLLTVSCFAQNIKVTAYRLVNENDDGPCSVSSYVRWGEKGFIPYVTAESVDPTFAKNLLTLKKMAKNWKKKDHFCRLGSLGGDMTHNMFVIEFNGKSDTILATYDNKNIVFPGKEKRYIDEKSVLKSMFPENIREFFKYDFDQSITSMFRKEDDSITFNKILFQGKPAKDIFKKDLEQQPDNFKLVSKDSLYNEIEIIYSKNSDTIRYYQGINITARNRNSSWDIGGFKPGNTESALIAKYPASTKIQKYFSIRYEDIKRNYFYRVGLTENNGDITYIIKDHVIDAIIINLSL